MDIKAGDCVAIRVTEWSRTWWEVATVERITPSGRIIVKDCDRQFNPDGSQRGGQQYCDKSKRVYAMTPEIEKTIAAQTARTELKHLQVHKFSEDEAIALYVYAKQLGVL